MYFLEDLNQQTNGGEIRILLQNNLFQTFPFIEFGKNRVLIRLEHCIEICYYHFCAFPTRKIQVFRRESSDRKYQSIQKKSVVVQEDSSSESESGGGIVCTKRIKNVTELQNTIRNQQFQSIINCRIHARVQPCLLSSNAISGRKTSNHKVNETQKAFWQIRSLGVSPEC